MRKENKMHAKKIKEYREKKGFTAKQLASMIGVSPPSITYFEQGLRNPTLDTLERIADALGVEPTSLLSR